MGGGREWTKKDRRAARKAERIYWAKLGVDVDELWLKLLERYGKPMSITEFLLGSYEKEV